MRFRIIICRPLITLSLLLLLTMNRFVHTFTSSIRPSIKSTRQQYYYSSTNLCAKRQSIATGNKKKFRADRVLSNRGTGSRSECFELLKQKRVFQKLDGNDSFTLVKGPSEKVSMNVSRECCVFIYPLIVSISLNSSFLPIQPRLLFGLIERMKSPNPLHCCVYTINQNGF